MDNSSNLFFSFITQIKNQNQAQAVLKTIDNNQLLELQNISLNILKGLIPLNENQREFLKKDRNFVRNLAAGEAKPITIARHWKTICFMIKLIHNGKKSEKNGSSTDRGMGTNSRKIIRTSKFESKGDCDSESEYEFSSDEFESEFENDGGTKEKTKYPNKEEHSNEFVTRETKN